MTKQYRVVLLCVCLVTMMAFGCAPQQPQQPPPPPDTRAGDAAAIKSVEAAWVKAGNNVDQFMTFYAEDAVVLAPNEPAAVGKEAIRKILGPMLGSPGFTLNFQSTKVEVARSGDLAYSQGTYEMTMNDPKGKPMTDKGKFVTVWKKQADGSWKAIQDMISSDLPAQPPPAPAKKSD